MLAGGEELAAVAAGGGVVVDAVALEAWRRVGGRSQRLAERQTTKLSFNVPERVRNLRWVYYRP